MRVSPTRSETLFIIGIGGGTLRKPYKVKGFPKVLPPISINKWSFNEGGVTFTDPHAWCIFAEPMILVGFPHQRTTQNAWHAPMRKHTPARACTHTCANLLIHKHKHTNMNTNMHAHASAHINISPHKHTNTQTNTPK